MSETHAFETESFREIRPREKNSRIISDVQGFLGTRLPENFSVKPEQAEALAFLDSQAMEKGMLERKPFFFIEKAVAIPNMEKGGYESVLALAPMTEERSAGHFPGRPIVPLIELCKAMAQSGLILTSLHGEPSEAPIAIKAGESNATAKDLIEAPVNVLIHVKMAANRANKIFYVNGEAFAEGSKIGSLDKIVYTMLPREKILKRSNQTVL